MSRTSSPFFTIITATFNSDKTLPRLLQSLAEQTCQDFVWVCQDGTSSDETLAIAKQWEGKITTSIASEKDTGIYDAWNKAIARQGNELGEWVLFLGADDMLAAPDVLEKVMEKCQKIPKDVLFAAGDLYRINDHNTTQLSVHVDPTCAFKHLLYSMLPHTALFSRRETFKQAFDSNFQIFGDFDWLHKTWLHEKQLTALNMYVSFMYEGGISNHHRLQKLIWRERRKIAWTYKYKASSHKALQYTAYLEWLCYPYKLKLKKLFQRTQCGKKLWSLFFKIRHKLYTYK